MAANSTVITATGTISPKVFWPLAVSIGLTFVATFLSALTPDMLGAFGPLAFPLGLALGGVSQAIVAYMKSDELRDLGVKATAAILPAPVHTDSVSVDPAEVAPPVFVDESPLSFEDQPGN